MMFNYNAVPDSPAIRDAMVNGTDDGYAKVVYECAYCGNEIYEGETCYLIGDDHVCSNCIEEAKTVAELDDY